MLQVEPKGPLTLSPHPPQEDASWQPVRTTELQPLPDIPRTSGYQTSLCAPDMPGLQQLVRTLLLLETHPTPTPPRSEGGEAIPTRCTTGYLWGLRGYTLFLRVFP